MQSIKMISRSRGPRLLPAVLAAGLLWGAAGCGDRAAEAPTTTVINPPGSSTTVRTGEGAVPAVTDNTNAGPGGPTGTQAAVADEINKKIVRNPQMTGARITAVVDDAGIATLTGFTQNQQQKALAAKAASETTGIVSVQNKLEIRPTGGVGKAKPQTPPQTNTTVIVVPGGPSSGTSGETSPGASGSAEETAPTGTGTTEGGTSEGGGTGETTPPPPPTGDDHSGGGF